jgi:hypothetical protein
MPIARIGEYVKDEGLAQRAAGSLSGMRSRAQAEVGRHSIRPALMTWFRRGHLRRNLGGGGSKRSQYDTAASEMHLEKQLKSTGF